MRRVVISGVCGDGGAGGAARSSVGRRRRWGPRAGVPEAGSPPGETGMGDSDRGQ